MYGDYMATHNRKPGPDLPDVVREPAMARGVAQVHFYERDLRHTVAEGWHANRYSGLPEYDPKRYAAGPVPSSQVRPAQGMQPAVEPRPAITAGPSACNAGTVCTVGVGPDSSMWPPTVPTGAGQYMHPLSVPFVPRNLGMEHDPRHFKTLPPAWLRQIPAAGLHSRRRDNFAW